MGPTKTHFRLFVGKWLDEKKTKKNEDSNIQLGMTIITDRCITYMKDAFPLEFMFNIAIRVYVLRLWQYLLGDQDTFLDCW